MFRAIQNPYIRILMVEFTNKYYLRWSEECVECPNYDQVRNSERSNYCDGCESGWTFPLDEDGNPDETQDLEFICEEDCENFQGHVEACAMDNVVVDMQSIKDEFDRYLVSIGFNTLPPLHPPLPPPELLNADLSEPHDNTDVHIVGVTGH